MNGERAVLSARRTSPRDKLEVVSPSRAAGWRSWLFVLAMLCASGTPNDAQSAEPARNARAWPDAPFNFLEFTGSSRFHLNTLPTTAFGKPWADILVKPENFLQCKGASIALCYYSGPDAASSPGAVPTPCKSLLGDGIANCTCYEIPAGPTYLVDINAILNLDVYLDTVKTCGHDGSLCKPNSGTTPPVCDAINNNTLIPGADLISTFSLYLESTYPTQSSLSCESAPYAGCMTAPCRRTVPETIDPVTGLPLVQCSCPIATGNFQVGYPNGNSCSLGATNVWSAAFAPLQELLPPPPPDPSRCWPDSSGASGCPILLPKPPAIPATPAYISCKDVCSEYANSSYFGVEVAFTCDATLCTASSDPLLVNQACSGLGNSSVSETLKLEVAIGKSCSASQVCGCVPTKRTSKQIFRFNVEQQIRGIATQCDLNGTLCGEP